MLRYTIGKLRAKGVLGIPKVVLDSRLRCLGESLRCAFAVEHHKLLQVYCHVRNASAKINEGLLESTLKILSTPCLAFLERMLVAILAGACYKPLAYHVVVN